MPVLAHASHWLVNLIYIAPVLIVGGWVAAQSLQARRRQPTDSPEENT